MEREYLRLLLERFTLGGTIMASIAVLGGGFYLAREHCDPHWMNRSGAAVVIFQGVAGIAEFARRRRLERVRLSLREDYGRRLKEVSRAKRDLVREAFLDKEIQRSEFHAIAIVLGLAAVGEFFHGFGDLVFQLLTR
jgi:hypothetical protein